MIMDPDSEIAPSLAVGLGQAAWDIANIESQIASRHTASMLSASALLTRAAALARAAEEVRAYCQRVIDSPGGGEYGQGREYLAENIKDMLEEAAEGRGE